MKAACLIIFALALALAGCTQNIPGVEISDEERAACAAQKNCTVWTEQQLENVAKHFYRMGQQASKGSSI